MLRILYRSVLIAFIGAAIGLAVNAFSPRRIPYLRPPKVKLAAADQITLERAKALWQTGDAIFLDARLPAAYAAGHIAGALHLSVETFDTAFPSVRSRLAADMALVLYCDGEQCDDSNRLLLKLRALGYSNAHVLVNGWTVWQRAKLPATRGVEP